MSDMEYTFNRIRTQKGVCGIVIFDYQGTTLRSTMDTKLSAQYSTLLSQLAVKARSVVRDLDPQNDLTFLRVRSKKHEILVAPDTDYILVVVQDPTADGTVSV